MLHRLCALFLTTVLLAGGCANPPRAAEGEVRYRGRAPGVLVLCTDRPAPRISRRAPSLGSRAHVGRARVADVRAVVDALALGRLIAELENLGFFDLPGSTARSVEGFPSFAIEVQATLEAPEPERRALFVRAGALRTRAHAEVFERAAAAVVRSGGAAGQR